MCVIYILCFILAVWGSTWSGSFFLYNLDHGLLSLLNLVCISRNHGWRSGRSEFEPGHELWTIPSASLIAIPGEQEHQKALLSQQRISAGDWQFDLAEAQIPQGVLRLILQHLPLIVACRLQQLFKAHAWKPSILKLGCLKNGLRSSSAWSWCAIWCSNACNGVALQYSMHLHRYRGGSVLRKSHVASREIIQNSEEQEKIPMLLTECSITPQMRQMQDCHRGWYTVCCIWRWILSNVNHVCLSCLDLLSFRSNFHALWHLNLVSCVVARFLKNGRE